MTASTRRPSGEICAKPSVRRLRRARATSAPSRSDRRPRAAGAVDATPRARRRRSSDGFAIGGRERLDRLGAGVDDHGVLPSAAIASTCVGSTRATVTIGRLAVAQRRPRCRRRATRAALRPTRTRRHHRQRSRARRAAGRSLSSSLVSVLRRGSFATARDRAKRRDDPATVVPLRPRARRSACARATSTRREPVCDRRSGACRSRSRATSRDRRRTPRDRGRRRVVDRIADRRDEPRVVRAVDRPPRAGRRVRRRPRETPAIMPSGVALSVRRSIHCAGASTYVDDRAGRR